jgi:hypothetical protein
MYRINQTISLLIFEYVSIRFKLERKIIMNSLINTSNPLKKLWLIFITIIMLLSMPSTAVFADDEEPPEISGNSKTVPTDPNRVLSPEEQAFRDEKYSALQEFIEPSDVSAYGSIPGSTMLVVGTWKQPNDNAHINHCGPGATQVALDARWPAAKVYGIDKIGVDEKTNAGGLGTNMQDIVKTLNRKDYLGSEFPNPNGMKGYWLDLAHNAPDLLYKASFDTARGYAMITGVKTKGMPGWGTYDAPHIVAVIGYRFTATNQVYLTYTDTSTPKAGFNGIYRNTIRGFDQ